MSFTLNNLTKFDGVRNSTLDASARLRVSQPITLGDYKMLGFLSDDLYSYTGSGAFTYDESTSRAYMEVSGSQYYCVQSRYWHPYQSGKGVFMEFTVNDFHAETGVTKRIGYFNASTSSAENFSGSLDGLYIMNDGTDYYVGASRNGVQSYKVPRSEWDDPLDGTGPSGLTIDFSNFNVFAIDFLWLGGTAIRYSAVISGSFVEFHKQDWAGQNKYVFIKSPVQPIRAEVYGSAGNNGRLGIMCGQVSVEGTTNTVGNRKSATFRNATAVDANVIGTQYALIGIRQNPAYRGKAVEIENFQSLILTADSAKVQVLKNPTVAGTVNFQNASGSAVQIAYADVAGNPSTNTVTGGEELYTILLTQNGANTIENKYPIQLTSAINGVADEYWVVITPYGANLDVAATINWVEY